MGKVSNKKYGIHAFGPQGRGYILWDTDILGLTSALQHGLDDGYFKENEEWAKLMVARLQKLRKPRVEGERF